MWDSIFIPKPKPRKEVNGPRKEVNDDVKITHITGRLKTKYSRFGKNWEVVGETDDDVKIAHITGGLRVWESEGAVATNLTFLYT